MTRERRATRRMPVAESQSAATLCVGRSRIPAVLVNRSAHGLGIECPATLVPAEGDLLRLRIYSGWIEARVVHVELRLKRAYVGLQWQRDLSEAEAAPAAHRLTLVGVIVAAAVGVAAGMYFLCDGLPAGMPRFLVRG